MQSGHRLSNSQSRRHAAHGIAAGTGGFGILETMAVLVIISIFTVIAISEYQSQVQKARRIEGTSTLLNLALLLNSHYANNGTYASATVATLMGGTSSENSYYTLSINPLAADSYTLRAAPASVHAGDGCGTLTLDSLGIQSLLTGTATVPVNICWPK